MVAVGAADDTTEPKTAARPHLTSGKHAENTAPENPILSNMRADAAGMGTAQAVSEYLDEAAGRFANDWAQDFTPTQISHALRVLTRLEQLLS